MKNLQEEHVRLANKLSKNEACCRILILKKLLTDNELLVYFKKRLKKYKLVKENKQANRLIKTILNSKSPLKIAEILCQENNHIAKNLQGVLIHSYLQFKDGVNLTEINPRDFLRTKKEILNRLIEKIKISKYRVGLFVWGSYVMRQSKFSIFSDLDLVMIIDDEELFKKNNFNEFLINLFTNVKHYNLPSVNELTWLKNNNGVARCGFIHNGVFVNFKILTKTALTSCLQVFKESLKEKSREHLIPGFNGEKLFFDRKDQIPVYPIIKENGHYTIGRGLITEFFHTGKLIACSNKKLRQELKLIQAKAIAKGLKIASFYCNDLEKLPEYLLELSHTPKREFNQSYVEKLEKWYAQSVNKYKKEGPFILQYLYSRVVLPLLTECPKKYWTENTLVAFFLGSPAVKTNLNIGMINEAFQNYFDGIDLLQREVDPKDFSESTTIVLRLIRLKQLKSLINSVTREIGRINSILLFTSFIDFAERILEEREDYYLIVESIFPILFPKEYKKAATVLMKIDKQLNHGEDILLIKRNLESKLLGKGDILKITSRIRQPAGLFQHHLMKQEPLSKINDIVSFQIYYSNEFSFPSVCRLTKSALSTITKADFQRKLLKLEEYRGYHLYFLYKDTPFEIMVRDLRSNIAIKHKIEHSIKQKIEQRLATL